MPQLGFNQPVADISILRDMRTRCHFRARRNQLVQRIALFECGIMRTAKVASSYAVYFMLGWRSMEVHGLAWASHHRG